jgi:hypothetical protein
MKKIAVILLLLLQLSSFVCAKGVGKKVSDAVQIAFVTVKDTATDVKESYVEWKDPYIALTKIYISSTDYENYTEYTYGIPVGEEFLIKVEVTIINNGILTLTNRIGVDMVFPSTKIAEVNLDKATGKNDVQNDSINGTTTYHFVFRSSSKKEAIKYTTIFRCTPLKAGTSKIQITYNDEVAAAWDTFSTLQYID